MHLGSPLDFPVTLNFWYSSHASKGRSFWDLDIIISDPFVSEVERPNHKLPCLSQKVESHGLPEPIRRLSTSLRVSIQKLFLSIMFIYLNKY